MRKPIAAFAMLLAVSAPQSAFALKATDTMADWVRASDAERSGLLDALQAKIRKPAGASRTAVIACMNRAAKAEGHREIRVDEMAQACSESMKPGDDPGETEI